MEVIPAKEQHKRSARTKQEKTLNEKSGKAAGRLVSRERRLQEAKQLTLFSDAFASVVFKDPGACQYVLRVLTGDRELKVTDVRTQYRVSRISSRDAVLDVMAEDSRRKLYNMEIQRPRTTDHARRVRFYGSMIDSEFIEKGTEYGALPDICVIYVSETDIWSKGVSEYLVKKVLVEGGRQRVRSCGDNDGSDIPEIMRGQTLYNDGQYVRYVNAAVDDGTETARLMRYFKTADPSDMSHGALSVRVHYLKCEEGGREEMCEVTEKWRQEDLREGRREGRREGAMKHARETARRLFGMGMPAEQIAEAVSVNIGQVNRWLSGGAKRRSR